MKTYKVRATSLDFLQELEIEAESEEKAEQKYREIWEKGELITIDHDLDVTVEGGD